jgi:hypothetical protein
MVAVKKLLASMILSGLFLAGTIGCGEQKPVTPAEPPKDKSGPPPIPGKEGSGGPGAPGKK